MNDMGEFLRGCFMSDDVVTLKRLANLVLHTADTREAMFNEEAFKLEVESEQRKWDDRKDTYSNAYRYRMLADPTKFYGMTLEEAAKHSCKYFGLNWRFANLIDLVLDGWWNNTIEWAESVLGKWNIKSVVTEVFRQLHIRRIEWEDSQEWLNISDNLADIVEVIAKRYPEATVEEIEEGIKRAKKHYLNRRSKYE